MRGRPIVSSLDSGTRKIQNFLTTLLQPLVESHVRAHLKSTSHFIASVRSLHCDGDFPFASLDVVDLYGSIPVKSSDGSLDLISVVTEFFDTHKRDAMFPQLRTKYLIRLILLTTDDCNVLDGDIFKQTRGIAMGNSAAPVLASIFMNAIESQVCESDAIWFWARYVDDGFLIYDPDDDILTRFNGIHPAIRFTMEEASEDRLPFLDTMVFWDREQQRFEFSLYVKDLRSDSCLPFSAHVPASRKRALLIDENHGVMRNSSDVNVEESKARLRGRFYANGHPRGLVGRLFDARPSNAARENEREDTLFFLKVPFYGEQWKRQLLHLAQRTGLIGKVRIVFQSEKPFSMRFRRSKELPKCPPNCWTCEVAVRRGQCFKKFAVYELQCTACPKKYIGQTGRTIKSRLREHSASASSAFHQHTYNQRNSPPETCVRWRILAMQRNMMKRRALEAIFISQQRSSLVNGCSGDALFTFVTYFVAFVIL